MIRSTFRLLVPTALLLVPCLLAADEPADKTADVKVKDITLKVPSTWKQEEPSNKLRLAQFAIPKAEGDKEATSLVISSFPGGGGVDQNLPRWVGEFSPDGRSMKMTSGKSKQGEYVVVDLKGTHIGTSFARRPEPLPGARMLAVLLKTDDDSYYFTLVGPEKSVAAQAEALRGALGVSSKDEKEYKLEK
ncbi:MAG: hypothetical protein IT428_05185 [Planctomycetaceae bacterium]|nr:hypothetical protein [Planctomycetaceae bacterium]